MVYSTIQHPPTPLPHSHALSVYTIHLVWEGGGEVREKIEGQQYTSLVPSWGQQFTSCGPKIITMSECISSL
jgi:hypothetical protein